MNVYLAGPMRGYPNFNFPAFHQAAAMLRAGHYTVFNPAERDEAIHGTKVSHSPTGNLDDIKATGFSLREALEADTAWICSTADAIALLPGWEKSKGAVAEKALAEAIGLEVIIL
jgi:hypothetical protein